MKLAYSFVVAGTIALSMSMPVSALDLLGGLVKLGKDSSKSDNVVSVKDDKDGTSIGVLGKDGASINLPNLTGGKNGNVPLNTNISVPGVASVTTGNGSGGGVTVIVDPGNGGGGGGGGGGGIDNDLFNTLNGLGGGSGGLDGISDRLRMLLQMLAERNHIAMANGNAVCLKSFGVTEVSSWIKRSEWGVLQQALNGYSQDIYMLRQLLANCPDPAHRRALKLSSLNRTIGIDIDASGRPVLFLM